ncbi:aminoglycoside N(3)-acetyltransferase [Sediminibacillus albus]|uniref:Aminoglycoside N(3)-acetyltransferase n=1 Tax=Sediminibacillus albus TaxID=407036 RepID=A0A1G8WNY1_9BACI|nr:AAC(3) family N-acetyltransferase [Sediminibacillus albus]SDJ79793.1 aminoglycoside 3-N-acetyltransferase [Sediminibacillus albus]
MGEKAATQILKKPNTRTSLHKELTDLGMEKGMVVIVHSSLSALGWVCGGPTAVIQALMDAVGEEGTIVMPAQTGENSDPRDWEMPPVPEDWWPIIREEMPGFDPAAMPSRGMGKIAEAFRSFVNVKRSNHPTYSFTAWGKHADFILAKQPLEAGFGEESPLAKIYYLDGHILLLGVGHDSNTSLHFAEHAIPNRKTAEKGTAILENGKRIWKTYQEIVYDSDPFAELGKDFEKNNPAISSQIGAANVKLIKQRPMVDYARKWLQEKN